MWSEVSHLVEYVVVLDLKNDFTKIKLSMHEPSIVSKVNGSCKLDGHIIDLLNVGARHIDSQIKFQTFNVIEDVSSIVLFHHDKLRARNCFDETIKGRDDIGVCL